MEDVAVATAPKAGKFRWSAALSAWLPVLVYGSLIVYLSSRPAPHLPRWPLLHHDKILHALEYAVLGALLFRALRLAGESVRRALLEMLALALVFAVSDEWHQSFVPGRQGNDWADLLADAIGVLLGGAASSVSLRWTVGGRS